MWFNNKINSNGTIHFDRDEWICTDADNGQFCRKISVTEFEYIQLKDMNGKEHTKHLLDILNDKTTINDWYQCEIDVTDYDAEELGEYVAPYGGILDGVEKEQDRNQLMAECIFETDLISGDYD